MTEVEMLAGRYPVLAMAMDEGRIPRTDAVARKWVTALLKDRKGTEAWLARMPARRFSQPKPPKATGGTGAPRSVAQQPVAASLPPRPSAEEIEQAEHDRFLGAHFPGAARAMGKQVVRTDLTRVHQG